MITFTDERTDRTKIVYVDEMSIEAISTMMSLYEDTLGLLADTSRLYK